MEPSSCCFTGHRNIIPAHLSHLTAQLDATIEALYRMGCFDFYAGGARGFDTLAAERVLEMKKSMPELRLHLLLPCRDQCRGWPAEDIARYEAVLTNSDSYRYIAEEY